MAAFNDLPTELLPVILRHLVRPDQLASACLVNKKFHTFAVTYLYQIISIFPWHKNPKIKVIKLFDTLAAYPDLARHVRRLEIRDFPKSLKPGEYERTLNACLLGISNAINLKSCTWLRDGSINSDILRALQRCPRLDDLEINGNHFGHYDPNILKQFTSVRKIRLTMPSALVIETLPAWIGALNMNLQNLTIICKSSSFVTDELLRQLAPHLVQLEELHVVGCTRLTHEGILAIITQNETGIKSLSIEGLSPVLDIAEFSLQSQRHRALRSLNSFTVTIGSTILSTEWAPHIVNLLSASPLEYFQIYCWGGHKRLSLDDDLCQSIVSTHKDRLKRFSIHKIPLSLSALDDICTRCVNLEQLFIVVEHGSLTWIGESLSKARKLKAIHINFPLKVHADDFPEITSADLLPILEQCSSTVVQVGYNTRVWKVERELVCEDESNISAHIKLWRYDSPAVPEQFRVVQT